MQVFIVYIYIQERKQTTGRVTLSMASRLNWTMRGEMRGWQERSHQPRKVAQAKRP